MTKNFIAFDLPNVIIPLTALTEENPTLVPTLDRSICPKPITVYMKFVS